MPRLPALSRLLLGLMLACGACTPTTYNPLRDRPDYVDRVLEDVTAMIEGMTNAHGADRIKLRDPNFRSSHQPLSP